MHAVVDPFVFGPSATSASAAIASLLYSIRRNRRSDAAAESLDEHGLLEPHVAFQQAAVSVLYRLTYLSATGLPPSRLGILWTWPASYRMTRNCPSAIESLQLTFSAAAITGRADLLDLSAAVFEDIGRSLGSFTRRGSGKEVCSAHMREAYQKLGEYTATLRERIAPQTGAALE